MIGNDIIDLNLAQKESNWQRKGFLEKQFSKQEQDAIQSARNSFLKVWLFWSMKEAAYKIYAQKAQQRFFAPLKFECFLTNEKQGYVCFEEQTFFTTSCINENYLYTFASENEAEVTSTICAPHQIENEIKKSIQKRTGIKVADLVKKKDLIGVPQFFFQEKLVTRSCTITHHGNYGAFAFVL